MREVPRPEIFAPIAIRQWPRSSISGSRAALLITVSPLASVAAISAVSVAPTETNGKFDRRALQAALARAR